MRTQSVEVSSAMATPLSQEEIRAMKRQAEQRKMRRIERYVVYAFLSLPAMGFLWLFLLWFGLAKVL